MPRLMLLICVKILKYNLAEVVPAKTSANQDKFFISIIKVPSLKWFSTVHVFSCIHAFSCGAISPSPCWSTCCKGKFWYQNVQCGSLRYQKRKDWVWCRMWKSDKLFCDTTRAKCNQLRANETTVFHNVLSYFFRLGQIELHYIIQDTLLCLD